MAKGLFREPDIYVWDTISGELTDLTDDGISGDLFVISGGSIADVTSNQIDVLPLWTEVGQLMFLRFNGQRSSMDILFVNLSGEVLNHITQVNLDIPDFFSWGITSIDISADNMHLAIAYMPNSFDRTSHGIWTLNLNTTQSKYLLPMSPEQSHYVISAIEYSPDDESILVYEWPLGNDTPKVGIVSLDGIYHRLQTRVNREATSAGWAPNERIVAFLTIGPDEVTDQGLHIIQESTKYERSLYSGFLMPPGYRANVMKLTWAHNNTILVGAPYRMLHINFP